MLARATAVLDADDVFAVAVIVSGESVLVPHALHQSATQVREQSRDGGPSSYVTRLSVALFVSRVYASVTERRSAPTRGWYGIKRQAADLAEDFESDERVLNTVNGHDHTRTGISALGPMLRCSNRQRERVRS
jgi:hypothetical protein